MLIKKLFIWYYIFSKLKIIHFLEKIPKIFQNFQNLHRASETEVSLLLKNGVLVTDW